jgi:hypothetical protein
LKKTGETAALAAMNLLDIGRLDEVMVIFTRFIKYVAGICFTF